MLSSHSITAHNFQANTQRRLLKYQVTMTERRPSGHGLDDEAIREGHDFIHKAEQEENERAAQGKRGLPDSAIDAEREFEDMVEGNNQRVCGVSNHDYTPPQQPLTHHRRRQNHLVPRSKKR